jgi:hypothetical protein
MYYIILDLRLNVLIDDCLLQLIVILHQPLTTAILCYNRNNYGKKFDRSFKRPY